MTLSCTLKSCVGLAFYTTVYNDCIVAAVVESNDSALACGEDLRTTNLVESYVIVSILLVGHIVVCLQVATSQI